MRPKVLTAFVAALGVFAALLVLPAVARNGDVRLSHNGVGAYIGLFYGHLPYPDPANYCGTGRAAGSPGCPWSLEQNSNNAIAFIAISDSMIKLYIHQGVYCDTNQPYPYNFSGGPLNFEFPGIHVNASGSFQKGGMGRRGYVTVSGQINGDTAAGTFSLTSSHDGKYSCMTLNVPWRATFDPTAEPNPALFR